MATLYVEDVPNELYEALRARARRHRRSMAAEVVSLLEDNIPTEKELQARRAVVRRLKRSGLAHASGQTFPSTEEMQREDRAR